MPAPTGPSLKSAIELKMGPRTTQSIHFQKFIKAMSEEISKKWDIWIKSMAWGANTVVGAGLGVWSGVGSGGSLHASPFEFSADAVFTAAEFTVRTTATKKFLDSLNKILGKEFDIWAKSYKTTAVPYIGISGASVESPGPFEATNTSLPLISLGTGKNPSKIQKQWEVLLEGPPDPIFRLSHQFCYTRLFTEAVSSTIEKKFVEEFLKNSNGTGDKVVGVAAPGSGAGTSVSLATGKVI